MMVRFMRGLGRLVIGHPGLVTGVAFLLTLFLYANIHNLRTGTELTDMFGAAIRNGGPPARSARNWATETSSL
jgi:hypothetical protein